MVNAISEGSTTITAKCGTKTAKCALTVTKYTNEIKVSPATITFPSTGGSEIVQVVSSTPWQATTDADWLTISPSEGAGSQSVTISVNASAKGFMMTTTVSFTNTENSTTLQVTKEGKVMAFSVSSSTKVLFAPGNVKEQTGGTYGFAEPWETGNLLDWHSGPWWANREIDGNAAGTWRMFSYEEIGYVLAQRPNAEKLRGAGTIGTQLGYILLPDEWELPEGMSFSANTFRPGDNTYTTQQWSNMADAGAIFFALAYSSITTTTTTSAIRARYPSSTKTDDGQSLLGMHLCSVIEATQYFINLGHVAGDLFYELNFMVSGEIYSIRLVHDVE